MINFSPIALAQSLIRCPSVTPEEAGSLDLLEGWLKQLGFISWRLPYEGDNGPRTDNLFARLGTAAPHFCFAGHADVVPPGDISKWCFPPFAADIHDGYLYGRGTEDMKGAIACIVSAVSRFLSSSHQSPFTGSISFLITCDEEGSAINGTRKCMDWMRTNDHVPDAILVGEPTNPEVIGDMAKIGRRGSLNAHLTVHGHQGHVAYPQLADNPITRLVRILHDLKETALDEGTEFFLPSNLEVVSVDVGNPATNVIPAKAEAQFNIRFNALHQGVALEQWLHSICKSHSPDYTLDVKISGEAFLTPPGELSKITASAVQEITGQLPELSTTGGTSDARFLKDFCPVIEFGTTGKRAHMIDERVKVEDLELLTRCYLRILEKFFA